MIAHIILIIVIFWVFFAILKTYLSAHYLHQAYELIHNYNQYRLSIYGLYYLGCLESNNIGLIDYDKETISIEKAFSKWCFSAKDCFKNIDTYNKIIYTIVDRNI